MNDDETEDPREGDDMAPAQWRRHMDHPASIDLAVLRFSAVSREHSAYHLPAFVAGYLCAALDVPHTLTMGSCGTHEASFRVGYREGGMALSIYRRDAR